MINSLERKYKSMSYGELILTYIDKLKLKDYYMKSIDICPDESMRILLNRAKEDLEREINVIKNINYQVQSNYSACSAR